ncbi:RDD family protein [Pseudolysinimonas sp.]|uniref:RDD family protein n=1 Tax=Pseudolysinimonas sp. TaxID=2680009 RepID=UPI003783E637
MSDPAARDDSESPDDGLAVFGTPPPIPGAETAGPAYAEDPPTDARIAHPALRAFAFFLDGFTTVLVVIVVVFAGLGSGGMELFWAIPIVPLVAALLDTVLTALRGVTPAKALLGIRVVDADSGAPIGFGRAVLRSLVIVAPIAVGVLLTTLLSRLPYEVQDAAGGGFFGLVVLIPIAGWIVLLVVLASRPRHRGLQDLAGRSVVVHR